MPLACATSRDLQADAGTWETFRNGDSVALARACSLLFPLALRAWSRRTRGGLAVVVESAEVAPDGGMAGQNYAQSEAEAGRPIGRR
jgi:hypothetical protein